MVGQAVREYAPLRAHNINVITQGSYRNNTNVRQESDVDICICCADTFFMILALPTMENPTLTSLTPHIHMHSSRTTCKPHWK